MVVVCVSDTPGRRGGPVRPDGVVDGARPGTLVIDCSTIAPSAAGTSPRGSRERGVRLVDARSRAAARARRTRRSRSSSAARPPTSSGPAVLAAMGKTITHVGPSGAGQAVKA
jgi:3-hydroxyisobutyrate dehydrogenase-like beta-hydroxyacid dehydrogenase